MRISRLTDQKRFTAKSPCRDKPCKPRGPCAVPQVVDTVELFHFKRQRKLSLRFLAGYLLRASIQQDTHDSVVDARTALSLFQARNRYSLDDDRIL